MSASTVILILWAMAAWLPVSAFLSFRLRSRAARLAPAPLPHSLKRSFIAAFPNAVGVVIAPLWLYALPIAGFFPGPRRAVSLLLLSLALSALISAVAAWRWPYAAARKRETELTSAAIAAFFLAANVGFWRWIYSVPGPSRDAVVAELPFEGEWKCASGGRWGWMNRHHGKPEAQNFAADFVIAAPDEKSEGKPVISPVEGTIESAVGDQPDEDGGTAEGNYIRIKTKEGALVMLAHLKSGTVKVRAGDAVAAGGKIAECGYSGSATMPHIHIHAERDGKPIPIVYREGTLNRCGIPMRRRNLFPVRGDLVAPVKP